MTFKFLKSDLNWEHKVFNEDQKKDISLALSVNNKKIKQTENFFENIISAQKVLGLHPHPVFQREPDYKRIEGLIDPQLGPVLLPPKLKNPRPKNEDDDDYEENEEENKKEIVVEESNICIFSNEIWLEVEEVVEDLPINFISISNYRIDYATMKMILFCSETCEMDTLKLFYNSLDADTLQLIAENAERRQWKFKKFFFDYNPFEKALYPTLESFGKSESIQYLSLRSCSLTDTSFDWLCKGLAVCGSCIEYLDVSGNRISKDGLTALVTALKVQKMLKYVSLASNGITSSSVLKPLFEYIGRKKLTPEEVETYNTTKDDIQRIVQVNDKLRAAKKQTQPIPMQDPLTQEKGAGDRTDHWLISGAHLKQIDLSNNRIKDSVKSSLVSFLQKVHEDFLISLSFNRLTKPLRASLRKRFAKNLEILEIPVKPVEEVKSPEK